MKKPHTSDLFTGDKNKFSQCKSESTACETWCSACDHFRRCSTAQLRCELCKRVGISTSSFQHLVLDITHNPTEWGSNLRQTHGGGGEPHLMTQEHHQHSSSWRVRNDIMTTVQSCWGSSLLATVCEDGTWTCDATRTSVQEKTREKQENKRAPGSWCTHEKDTEAKTKNVTQNQNSDSVTENRRECVWRQVTSYNIQWEGVQGTHEIERR